MLHQSSTSCSRRSRGMCRRKIHFVVASRAAVHWPFCKLLLKGRAQRLGQDQLRFTQEEVAGLPRAPNTPTPRICKRWRTRCEAGPLRSTSCKSAANATLPRSRSSPGHPPDLAARYVEEQVLDAVPGAVIEALVVTATLERVSVPLLDALRGADDSSALLEIAISHGVPLTFEENADGWFSLHPFVGRMSCHGDGPPRSGTAARAAPARGEVARRTGET